LQTAYVLSAVPGHNSTTTVVPEIIVGSAAVAALGLGYDDDPQCHHATFSPTSGLLTAVSVRSDGLGCRGGGGGGGSGGGASTNTTHAVIRQNFWQYIDGSGGP
jgi:hypothetical protein